MLFDLPKKVLFILETLEKNGHEAYIVGGCVRDLFMGKAPNDYDITTNALPSQVKSYFERTADTGIKHGTVTVILENEPFEVTTYRTEEEYSNSRTPDKVEFVGDISLDLARRDFTVNAICYDLNGNIIDLFGGTKDIKDKILKAVGNPDERFFEDALRIMRLYRFAAKLGFEIEKDTEAAALKHIKLLEKISVERIFDELQKAVLGDNLKVLGKLINSGALSHLGLKNCQNTDFITSLEKKGNMRLYAFLKQCDCDKNLLKNLKASNKQNDYFKALDSIKLDITSSKVDIKKALRNTDFETLSDYIQYRSFKDNLDFSKVLLYVNEIKDKNEPYALSHLAVTGDDLKALGFKGKNIGNTLETLLSAVVISPEKNQKDILLSILK